MAEKFGRLDRSGHRFRYDIRHGGDTTWSKAGGCKD